MSIRLPISVRITQTNSLLTSSYINPRCIAPSFSTEKLEYKPNYLVVFDPNLIESRPFHYFPLKAEQLNPESSVFKIVSYPQVISPGIIMLKGTRLFRVAFMDIQRGKFTAAQLIENPEEFINIINGAGDTSNDSSEPTDSEHASTVPTSPSEKVASLQNSFLHGKAAPSGVPQEPQRGAEVQDSQAADVCNEGQAGQVPSSPDTEEADFEFFNSWGQESNGDFRSF